MIIMIIMFFMRITLIIINTIIMITTMIIMFPLTRGNIKIGNETPKKRPTD